MIIWEEPEITYKKEENFPLKEESFEIVGV